MTMTGNKLLEQQAEFLKNITRLVEFSDGNDYALILDVAHLDAGCQFGRGVYFDGLSLAFKLFRRTSNNLDYFHLESDHAMLQKYWLSLDTRCKYADRIYSMPWDNINI